MVLKIDVGGGPREVEAEEFPIAVGLSRRGEVVFGAAAERSPSLWLGYNGGRIFAQPDGRAKRLHHNGAVLRESVWIEDGDRVQIGKNFIYVSADQGALVLTTGADGDQATGASGIAGHQTFRAPHPDTVILKPRL